MVASPVMDVLCRDRPQWTHGKVSWLGLRLVRVVLFVPLGSPRRERYITDPPLDKEIKPYTRAIPKIQGVGEIDR